MSRAIKLNNQILMVLRRSSIDNDELMEITGKLDKLTALALRQPERPARTNDNKKLELDTIMNGTKWGDDR